MKSRALSILILMMSAAVTLAGCGSKNAQQTCEQAADTYVRCIGEVLGPEAGAMVNDKRDIAACAGDSQTVAMYEACLPKEGCEQFMDCLDDYAANH